MEQEYKITMTGNELLVMEQQLHRLSELEACRDLNWAILRNQTLLQRQSRVLRKSLHVASGRELELQEYQARQRECALITDRTERRKTQLEIEAQYVPLLAQLRLEQGCVNEQLEKEIEVLVYRIDWDLLPEIFRAADVGTLVRLIGKDEERDEERDEGENNVTKLERK